MERSCIHYSTRLLHFQHSFACRDLIAVRNLFRQIGNKDKVSINGETYSNQHRTKFDPCKDIEPCPPAKNLSYLILWMDSKPQALSRLQDARPVASPNPHFQVSFLRQNDARVLSLRLFLTLRRLELRPQ